jgi:fatty acid desaturase/predicted heme/steroid binding protein
MTKELPKYTWEDVKKHNCEETGVWVSMYDKVYDITKFLNSHPGGKEFLLLAAGRDITDLFLSYHPFTDKPLKVLDVYQIGTLVTYQYPQFKKDTGFYKQCCKEVGAYFRENKLDYKDPTGGIIRMSAMLAIYIIAYIAQFTAVVDNIITPSIETSPGLHNFVWWAHRLFFAVITGWSQMMFLLHIYHDCSHSSWGSNELWWKVGGRLFAESFIGTSMLSWHNQHVVGHHVYTAIFNLDPDVPMVADGDMRLVVPQQNNKWYYKYQHIYLLFLYTLLSFKNRIQDFDIHYRRKNGEIDVNPVDAIQWARLISSKLIHIIMRVVVPIYVLGFKNHCILYIFAEMVGGAYLAFNFQVSHVSHYAQVPAARAIPASQSFPINDQIKDEHHVLAYNIKDTKFNTENRIESDKLCRGSKGCSEASQEELMWDMEWAHLQVHTSVDYAYASKLCTFMVGALNYQTIHHLFPSVSQYHYPAIAPIVRKIAKEHGVKFNYVETFAEAIEGHVGFLRMMGEKGLLPLEIPEM